MQAAGKIEGINKIRFFVDLKKKLFGKINIWGTILFVLGMALIDANRTFQDTRSAVEALGSFLTTCYQIPIFFALLYVPACLLALFLVSVHESGHLAAGALAGYKFQGVSVGPIQIRKKPNSLSTKIAYPIFNLGGCAAMLPSKPDAWRLRFFILGGPIASLLSVVGALYLCKMDHGLVARIQNRDFLSLLDYSCVALFVASVSTAAFSFVPCLIRGGPNDALLLLMALRRKDAETSAVRQYASFQFDAGVRARDWDPVMVERMKTLREGCVPLLLYCYYLDTGSLEEAAKSLRFEYDNNLSDRKFIRPYRKLVAYEYATIEARLGRTATAREALEAGDAIDAPNSPLRNRALSAILYSEGNKVEAEEYSQIYCQEIATRGGPKRDIFNRAAPDWFQWLLDAHPPVKTNEPF